ncbi:DUF1479-domain-containing protein [Amylostereum chailletii]|nr:DUF1479-domain-containing protein [Amylostereum chailletii]
MHHGSIQILSRRAPGLLARGSLVRGLAVAAQTQVAPSRKPKAEGSIASVFPSLSGIEIPPLPPRFSDLKKEIFSDALVQSWNEVLKELGVATEQVVNEGAKVLPRIPFSDIQNGLTDEQKNAIKTRGIVIIDGGVSKEEALGWKQMLKEYITANNEKVRGFPEDNLQVFELYNSVSQTRARTHPALVATQSELLKLWHASDPSTPISLNTPISYYDRLRMRLPGDKAFTLGPHVDGGSLERWEDPQYRQCFKAIFEGRWRQHDPWDASPRIGAKMDLYQGASACSVFRPWQGWTSLSTTGPSEGTLRVCPMLPLATAYAMLRPFFRPRTGPGYGLNDWVLDLDGTGFPGCTMGSALELNEKTHPHLRLDETMVSAPKVEPGSQIYWHCDTIHAVESEHAGKEDSSVLYIPAIPLTVNNAEYLRDQRANFVAGLPSPDFPGGFGESTFVNRGSAADAHGVAGRRLLGFEKFEVPAGSTHGEAEVIRAANEILFSEL